ncbi:MAG: cytochrome c oxidase accessory protein CcoG [Planctomycetes bacterium]|nr:cytochrome c oxidase accessory protein CcoG [Planctomycetota bacterium]
MATDAPTTKPHQRRPDLDELYCINPDGSRNTIHPADVRGRYQTRKKLIWTILIATYLVLPWLRIGDHPAILLDIEHRNFFLFGNTFNAQDFWLAFFVLTGIGFTLFVISALFGRLWCGYGCPQTVFLDGVFRRVERWIDGSAAARKRLQQSGWTAEKVLRRGAKWGIYLAISFVLSHTLLGYFIPVRDVVQATTQSPAHHPTAFVFALIAMVIIYFNFTWFREQLCIVICPYGRLQGVLYDADTINVGYDATRGEPRGRYAEEKRGDCIDCYRCVAVCPTGIDIRNGTQLECIGCANCVDACDEVMAKLGQAPGLVRYDSQRGLEGGKRRFVRPRLFFYIVMFLIGVTVFAFAASERTPYELDVLRQRGAPYTIDNGVVQNSFTVRIFNKQPDKHTFELVLPAMPGVEFTAPIRQIELDSLANQKLPVFVRCKEDGFEHGREVVFEVRSDLGVQTSKVPLVGPNKK